MRARAGELFERVRAPRLWLLCIFFFLLVEPGRVFGSPRRVELSTLPPYLSSMASLTVANSRAGVEDQPLDMIEDFTGQPNTLDNRTL